MANLKISALTAVGSAGGTDEVPVNQGGTTKKSTLAQFLAYIQTNTGQNDLNDTVITSPANGHVLYHNGSNWVNGFFLTHSLLLLLVTGLNLVGLWVTLMRMF